MPFEPGDPLGSIGLEEAPQQTDSAWSGIEEWPSATDERADQAEGRLPDREDKSRWESPDNPYKQQIDRIKQQAPSVGDRLDATLRQNQQYAAEAWDAAVRAGMNPQVAQDLINIKLGELNTRAELEATREAALPHVRRGSADEIAREFSDKKAGVVINSDELLDERTMDGMRAKAKALQKERRDRMVTQRKANHVDRAEGGPPSSARRKLPDDVSPAMRIQYGLERGHL